MRDYCELGKLRIAVMVAVMAWLGYHFAGGRDKAVLAWTLSGTVLGSLACGAFNQLLERGPDALMKRTRNRPLPAGRMSPPQALAFATACSAAGLGLLYWKVNVLAAGLVASTIAAYSLAYTPLKRFTPQSTWIGSAAGATPPLVGWAAAQGELAPGAWALFAIQFLWQIPHFLALFWIYREEYAAAGFRVMPVVDPGGRATACQIAVHSFALLLASLMPVLFGMASLAYGYGALVLGTIFLVLGLKASWTLETADARRLFRASLAYLPALFLLMALGCGKPPPPTVGDFGPVPEFTLTDAGNRKVRRQDIPGPWVADFIFTRCGGQCPMMTARMRKLSETLPGVRFVSFSVDDADKPADLARYAKNYGANWTFLSGGPGEVRRLCREGFKLPAADGGTPAEPIVHSDRLVLVGADGHIRGYFDGNDPEALAALARQIRL